MECERRQAGRLEVILGPMFSGKSTELIRRIRRHTIAKQRCFVIKYAADSRYSVENMATHDRYPPRTLACRHLLAIFTLISSFAPNPQANACGCLVHEAQRGEARGRAL
jgi:thymidine kinase